MRLGKRQILIVLGLWFLLLAASPLLGANLLCNGSFEVGPIGWTWHSGYAYDAPDDLTVRPTIDRATPTAAPELGSASLKCVVPEGVKNFIVESGYIEVKEGQECTYSFYARSDRPARVIAMVTDGFQVGKRVAAENFSVGDKWQRYSVKVIPTSNFLRVSVWEYGGGRNTLWLDGLQLEEGALTAFAGWQPVEVGVTSGQWHNCYRPGEKVSPQFWFCQHGGSVGTFPVTFQTKETLTDKVIGEKKVSVTFGPGQPPVQMAAPYPLPSDRRGIFKTTVKVLGQDGQAINYCEHIYAVYEPIAIAPNQFDEDCMFAADHVIGWHHQLCHGGRDSVEQYFRAAAQAGIRWHRSERMRMKNVLPEPGKFQVWDNLIDLAARYGIGSMVTLGAEDHRGYIPDWAYQEPKEIKGHDGLTYYRIKLEAWREYCREMMKHFKGRVKYWECMNERRSNPLLPEYLRVAHQAAREVSPDSKILENFMGCDVSMVQRNENLRKIFREKEYPNLDIVSVHLYQSPENHTPPDLCVPSYESVFGYMRGLMQECGGEKPMWDTEGGIHTSSLYSHMTPPLSRKDFYAKIRTGGMSALFPRERQAVLAAAYNVRKCLIYTDLQVGRYFYQVLNHHNVVGPYYCMLEFDDTPKLMYVAQVQCARMLTGAKPVKKLEMADERMRGWAFRRRDGRLVLTIYNIDDREAEYQVDLPAGKLEIEDLVGNPVKPTQEGKFTVLPISGCPLYVLANDVSQDDLIKALEQGEVVGLVPFQMGLELARDPKSGDPAAAILVRNTGIKETAGEFRIAGYPQQWNPQRTSITIGPVSKGKIAVGYLPFAGIREESEPIYLKAFHVMGEELLEAGKKLRAVASCPRLLVPPRIDGNLDSGEWKGATLLKINRKDQVVLDYDEKANRYYTGAQTWQGPEDLSAEIYVTWDPDALYLGARVTTPHFIQNKTDPSKIFNSSCLEVFLSLDTLANAWDFLYQPSDYHFMFAPATKENPKHYQRAVREMNKPIKLSGVQIASRPMEGGWQMELRIPWRNFEEFRQAQSGSVIGFDVAIDGASETGNRKYQMVWVGTADNCARVDDFARLVLVESRR